MSYETKKGREKRYLERVKLLYAQFPQGSVVACEEPDFLITGEQTCGIELVQYIRGQGKGGSPIRWREELHDEIVGLAKSKYEAQSAIPVSVHLHWFHHRELRGADIDRISDEICTLVIDCLPLEINDSVGFEPDYKKEMSDFVSRISIRRSG